MYGTFHGHYCMQSAVNHVEITNWDVSNVTNMDLFAANCSKDFINFGDLRGWCVQHIPSRPTRWIDDSVGVKVFKEDPCWGECPPPGEIGTCGSEQAPAMPDGPWKTYAQQYYFRSHSGRQTIYFLTNVHIWYSDDRGATWTFNNVNSYWDAYNDDHVIVASNGTNSDDMIKFLGGNVDIHFLAADTSNVTNMATMFNSSEFSSDISWFDTFYVTNMARMFKNCRMFNADLSSWDTSSVNNMREMFYNNKQFKQDLSGWDVTKVNNHKDFDKNANSQWRVSEKPNWR
jgi:surface protein